MQRKALGLIAIVLVPFVVSAIIVRMRGKNAPGDRTVEVSIVGPPYSADPIDYDAFVHHIAFRSTYSSIVTQYHAGNFVGLLAETWSSDPYFKSWEFKVRQGIRFDNGDLITPEIIIQSWTRLAFLMKQKKSQSAFFDELEGIEYLTSPTSTISGLVADRDRIVIRLKSPTKNLLDTLSFGLYAVVHPNDYDSITGKWKDPHSVTASGPYRIKGWGSESISLERRPNYQLSIGHAESFRNIHLTWNPSHRSHADLVMGNSIDTDVRASHSFYGGANSSIAYARCRSWQVSSSPCFDKITRVALREAYYKEIEKRGFKVTRSFFPLAIKGVKELSSPDVSPSAKSSRSVKFAVTKIPNPLFAAFNETAPNAIKRAGLQAERIEIPFNTFMKEYDQNLPLYSADMYMLATGILIEDPMQDVRFMFFSQEGIRLPDIDGSIHAELQKDHPDIQYVNELLWEQAVIWPITHYASGFWATNDIDFSQINLVLPPSDFQWLGWK